MLHDHGFHSLEVVEVQPETDSAVSIAFQVPPPLRDVFSYSSGQFVTVRRVVDGVLRRRCYSLCSSPQLAEPLRIAVKRVHGGLVSNECPISTAAPEIGTIWYIVLIRVLTWPRLVRGLFISSYDSLTQETLHKFVTACDNDNDSHLHRTQ